MEPDNIKNLISFSGVIVTAIIGIPMLYFKVKEHKTQHENTLNNRFKLSLEYDEKFFKNRKDEEYSKNVKDAAAQSLVGSEKVDAFLVNLLLEFHEKNLIDINEMMYLFKRGYKFGYLKYDKNKSINESFRFNFSKRNSVIYYSNVESTKKTKKWGKIIFFFVFWLLIAYSLFFLYLVFSSTNFFDFIFPLVFWVLTFSIAFVFPVLSIAMDNTELFLEKFYQANKGYRKQETQERVAIVATKINSTVSNYSEYKRRY